jgi:uncharacterized protein
MMSAVMKCAKCSGTLSEIQVGQIHLDRCNRCQGLWFDRNELERILELVQSGKADLVPESLRNPLSDKLDVRFGTCPRCKKALMRTESVAVAELHYDKCAACGGAWLDGGELDKISADEQSAAIEGFFSKF